MNMEHLLDLARQACEARQGFEEARSAFFDATIEATDPGKPHEVRVPIKALAERIGVPRSTLVSQLETYRGEPGPTGASAAS